MKLTYTILAAVVLTFTAFAKKPVTVWTDPVKANAEHSKFQFVGEYSNAQKTAFHQVSLMKTDDYLVSTYKAGLPGRGWDKSAVDSRILSQEKLDALLKDAVKTNYISPTIGKKAPEGAVTMPEGFTKVKDGILWAGGQSNDSFGSFKMHLEFRLPFKPMRNPSNQDKGNSGIYIFNNYEIQVLDTFALDYSAEEYPFKTESHRKQWCGCFYKMQMADVNATLPALTWQTYDIDFTAPVFKDDKKVVNARITVLHNGIKIHDDVELKNGTGNGGRRKQLARGPIYFQDHGNPTAFRNVWIQETKLTK
jgi:hypothetical protein